MEKKNRILIFTGEGKGKTTAALGMAVRALGHGQRILILQFIKSDASVGELSALKYLPGVEVIQMGRGFVASAAGPAFPEHCQAARQALKIANIAQEKQFRFVAVALLSHLTHTS